jgi:hypothetical protein
MRSRPSSLVVRGPMSREADAFQSEAATFTKSALTT